MISIQTCSTIFSVKILCRFIYFSFQSYGEKKKMIAQIKQKHFHKYF